MSNGPPQEVSRPERTDGSPAAEHENSFRYYSAVALLIAVLLEVFPTERDILLAPLRTRNFMQAIALKSACLAAIFAPLGLYVVLNRTIHMKNTKHWTFRSLITIVVLNLLADAIVIANVASQISAQAKAPSG